MEAGLFFISSSCEDVVKNSPFPLREKTAVDIISLLSNFKAGVFMHCPAKKKIFYVSLIIFIMFQLCSCGNKSVEEEYLENINNVVMDPVEEVFEYKVEPVSDQIEVAENSPLKINEAVVSSYCVDYDDTALNYDYIELKNVSDEDIDLSDYYISDDENDLYKSQLPEKVLRPDDLFIIVCDSCESGQYFSCGFSLDAGKEDIYLSSASSICDFAHLEDIPVGGSYGRMDGEEGFFYFSSSSIGYENEDGKSFISKEPETSTQCGVFNGVDSIEVELSADGDIYYTLDSSLPDESSEKYTGPITLISTTVIRAVAVQDGGLPSKAVTLPFIINENHTLPVISVVTDDPDRFQIIYDCGERHHEQPGNISLFEDGECFNLDCGVNLSGKSSRRLFPKKNFKIQFRDVYGSSKLKYDFFGNGEIKYKSINLRAGQDSAFRIFNTDMWQDISYKLNENVISQHTKPCILYLNGKYYGIYSLKENVSKSYYAQIMGVSDDSVVQCDIPLDVPSDFKQDIYLFMQKNDMSIDENYEHVKALMDMDNFIDYCLIQGVCANEDLAYNVKAFKSTEGDGKYRFVLYDLDGAMKTDGPWQMLFKDQTYGFPNEKLTYMLISLFKNAEFKDSFLKRYSEVYSTVLSNESIVAEVEKYREIYRDEIERDRKTWYYTVDAWNYNVDEIYKKLNEKDWQNWGVKRLCMNYLHMTDEEILSYFPNLPIS